MKTTPINTLLSDNIKATPKSFIRELLRPVQQKELISFAGGLPDESIFPMKDLEESAKKILSNSKTYQYHISEGYLPLREKIAARYKQRGIPIHAKNILITSGAQQGLDLCGKVFLNPSDPIGVEEATYPGALQTLRFYRPEILFLPMDKEGLLSEETEQLLWSRSPKFLYLIPNYQNPTGICYSESRKKQITDLCAKYQTLIVEDDPYSELYFNAERPKDLLQYNSNNILLGSFSKCLVPGLRIGWMVIPENYYDAFLIAKQASDLHSDMFGQLLLNEYLENDLFDKNIGLVRQTYKNKKEWMEKCLRQTMPEEASWESPTGGMFIWLKLPEGIQAQEIFTRSLSRGVAFVPGSNFGSAETLNGYIRLNFTGSSFDSIEKGIKIISQELFRMLVRV